MSSFWCSLLLLGPLVAAQRYQLPNRPPGTYNYTQPANTTILTQYGDSEPVYPSPQISGRGGWEEALGKAHEFISQLSLEEKAQMVTGVSGPCTGNIYPIHRLNFSGLCLQDGPAAIRNADLSSVFPAGVTIASTWDKKMIYERSLALGSEFREKGAHIALTPAVGPMGRSPYSGRNWEGFSPDPYLSGVSMGLSVRGVQDAGVQATAKHYIANEQEIMRNPAIGRGENWAFEALSSNVDDRTMHELYLWPFADAVHEGVAAVMCSYQRINGSYGCQNSKTLNGILKTELGFQGYVMSDWFGTHAGVASIEAGLDMDMPGRLIRNYKLDDNTGYVSYFGRNVSTSVSNGTVKEDRIDDMIARILTPYFFLGQDQDFPSIDPSSVAVKNFGPSEELFYNWTREVTGPSSRDVRKDHARLIREHAGASNILLKNERKALPLRAPKTVYVFGNDAGDVTEGPLNQEGFEFGTYAVGGGSGAARLFDLISPLTAIREQVRRDNGVLQYWLNNTHILETDLQRYLPSTPDVCMVFTKSWASEGSDRESLDLDYKGNEMIDKVASVCSNTIVIIHSPWINTMPFADNPNVTAIISAHFPGEQSGYALTDVLYGSVNPSGHLPYTVAYNASDYNFAPVTTRVTTSGSG